ncbi:GNAT family N-acetyltransferase [Paracoccus sp. PAMC 22219]|uniref:GNAT family N-acetyltransferase n=1 Tax=Paracoccus sp. PAMC 22219 TaxID=1569209 RepID=UPI001E4EFBE3|nr:GNAT family N-acetyltransferase [Paracoccus sp. PAMC 22219]
MSGSGGVVIRPATPDDHDAIWAILEPVYRAGETYCIPRDVTRAEAIADWFAPPFTGFVAVLDGRILGTSHVGANRPAGGSHVANASFATHPDARGRGVARALVDHAKSWAAAQGSPRCSSISWFRPTPMPSICGRRPVLPLWAGCRGRFVIPSLGRSTRWSCSTP